MKANIFDIKHFAVHDGPGIRTTVFFKGCPLKCRWCHNPESISAKKQLGYLLHKCVGCGKCVAACPQGAHTFTPDGLHKFEREKCTACGACAKVCPADALSLYGKEAELEAVLTELLEDEDFYESSNGGVTLSGGECLIQADFCAELLKRLKENGIHTAVDTCGFVSREAIDKVLPYTDLFLYDMKAFDDDVHIRCTGQSNKCILENLSYIDKCGGKTEIRIPFVPDYNSDQIEKIAGFLSTLKNLTKIKILPYHNYAGTKYKSLDMPDTLPEKLPEVCEIKKAENMLSTFGLEIAK